MKCILTSTTPPALVILKHQNRSFDWRLALVCPCWGCDYKTINHSEQNNQKKKKSHLKIRPMLKSKISYAFKKSKISTTFAKLVYVNTCTYIQNVSVLINTAVAELVREN